MVDKRDSEADAILRLSGALAEMRDALTRLALSLRDYQFEQDPLQRQSAEAMLRDTLDKARKDGDGQEPR